MDLSLSRVFFIQNDNYKVSFAVAIAVAIVLVFSPVAGFLADVKFGRYKTLRYSMWLILAVSSLTVFSRLILFQGCI